MMSEQVVPTTVWDSLSQPPSSFLDVVLGLNFPMPDTARTDKWLWAVRLFKTRGLAAEMCAAGKVKRRGNALKAASALHAGDVLEVPFPEGPGTRSITVIALIEQRVAAPEARDCYQENTAAEVLAAREAWQQSRKDGLRGRPTKKNRRLIERQRGFFE